MYVSLGQHCMGFASWSLSERTRFAYFNEAGPAPDTAEVQAEKPEAKPEAPQGPVNEIGQQSFDDMAEPFNLKFNEFSRAAEESTGKVVMGGMRLTNMRDIGDQMRVLGRFKDISNDYHAKVRDLQANSPAYQEAVQTAKADLDELIAKMDARMQELKGEEGEKAPETSKEILREKLSERINTITKEVQLFDTALNDIRLYDITRYKDPEKLKDHIRKWFEENLIGPGKEHIRNLSRHMQGEEIDEAAIKRDMEASDKWLSQFRHERTETGIVTHFPGLNDKVILKDLTVQEVLPLHTSRALKKWLKPSLGNSLITKRGEIYKAKLEKELLSFAEKDPATVSSMASDYGIDSKKLGSSTEGREKIVKLLIDNPVFLGNLRAFHKIENK